MKRCCLANAACAEGKYVSGHAAMRMLCPGHPCQEDQPSYSCAGPEVPPAGISAYGQQASCKPVLRAPGHSSEDTVVQGWLGTR